MTKLTNGDGSTFNYRVEAGEKLYGYDTSEGACAHNGYAYLILFDRVLEKCKIVKVKLSSAEVVKVSEPLEIYHGNDLTYNTKTNRIVVACSGTQPKKLAVIDPESLTLEKTITLKLPSRVSGMSSSLRRKFTGVGAIAYNESKGYYLTRMKETNNFIRMDSNFKATKYFKAGSLMKMINQGMDSKGSYIFSCQSFYNSNDYNQIVVRNLSGKFYGKLRIDKLAKEPYELECVFHDGDDYYALTYFSRYDVDENGDKKLQRVNTIFKLNNLKESIY